MWILSLIAACASSPCGGVVPSPVPSLEAWPGLPVAEGVVCQADATSLAVDYPGRVTEAQLTSWAQALESQGWQVVELAEPEKRTTDSRWVQGESNLSLSVSYRKPLRVTTVYVGRY